MSCSLTVTTLPMTDGEGQDADRVKRDFVRRNRQGPQDKRRGRFMITKGGGAKRRNSVSGPQHDPQLFVIFALPLSLRSRLRPTTAAVESPDLETVKFPRRSGTADVHVPSTCISIPLITPPVPRSPPPPSSSSVPEGTLPLCGRRLRLEGLYQCELLTVSHRQQHEVRKMRFHLVENLFRR